MFILASSSPRRRALLKKLIADFVVVPPDVDEGPLKGNVAARRLPLEESRLKAYDVYQNHPDDEVLACDTIVLLGEMVLGKPADMEDAFRMLQMEAGKTQIVLSGYTYISKDFEISRTVMSRVTFNPLSDEEIRRYIEKYRPLDKAGAYGIQDEARLIASIEGSYDNVMGLPTEDIAEHVFKRRR